MSMIQKGIVTEVFENAKLHGNANDKRRMLRVDTYDEHNNSNGQVSVVNCTVAVEKGDVVEIEGYGFGVKRITVLTQDNE